MQQMNEFMAQRRMREHRMNAIEHQHCQLCAYMEGVRTEEVQDYTPVIIPYNTMTTSEMLAAEQLLVRIHERLRKEQEASDRKLGAIEELLGG